MWKLNNAMLNDNLVKEEIRKEIKDFLEFNENKGTIYPNLWDTMEAVLKGKHIALSASKKKPERACISSLTAHLKALEQKEANTPKRSIFATPFTKVTSNMKYLDGTLTKQVKDLYDRNFKTLKKKIKEHLRRWKDLS